jgi:hypothetical protein
MGGLVRGSVAWDATFSLSMNPPATRQRASSQLKAHGIIGFTLTLPMNRQSNGGNNAPQWQVEVLGIISFTLTLTPALSPGEREK